MGSKIILPSFNFSLVEKKGMCVHLCAYIKALIKVHTPAHTVYIIPTIYNIFLIVIEEVLRFVAERFLRIVYYNFVTYN